MRKLAAAIAVVLLVHVAGIASAADPINLQVTSVEEQTGRISATVSVTGADGKPISGLGTPNFKGTLGDVPLNVSDLLGASAARQPASIVLAVDVSGSMGGEPINQAKAAMQDFIRSIDAGDRVAIVTFGNQVTLFQDFTSERTSLSQAIGRINALGETALYEGVTEALRKIGESGSGRRMVVVLSDGSATSPPELRAQSIEAAAQTGVSIVAVGFGTQIDRPYLTELAAASGGRFVQTSTAAAIRQTYTDIANSLRSQYTVVLAVPKTVDRTVPAKLQLQVVLREDSGLAERALPPLPGAVVPAFDVKLGGLKANQKLAHDSAVVSLTPKFAAGANVVHVDYLMDGQKVGEATAAPFKYDIKASALSAGNHLVTARAWEAGGRSGEAQLAFKILPPPAKSLISTQMIVMMLLGGVVAVLAYFIIKKKSGQLRGAASRRVTPFTRRSDEVMTPVDGWPAPVAAPKPLPVPVDRALGRIVVMDEVAVRGGNLDAIREYEIKTQPLTLGTGDGCDIQVSDDQGRIAGEEARLWVQRGRLVYHKLTTLSAMATEGVTSGWEFLESGEELHLGPYRILFEQYVYSAENIPEPEPEPQYTEEELQRPMQEHGMGLNDTWAARLRNETQFSQQND